MVLFLVVMGRGYLGYGAMVLGYLGVNFMVGIVYGYGK